MAASTLTALPGPPSGLVARWRSILRFGDNSVGYARELFEAYGSVVRLRQGGPNLYASDPGCPGTVLVYGPENVRQVANENQVFLKHPLSGRTYRRRGGSERAEALNHFGVGLFGVNGDRHQQHRQLMMPAFHKRQIATHRDDIVAFTQAALDRLQVGQQYDMSAIMRSLTMQVAAKAFFGEEEAPGGSTGGSTGSANDSTGPLIQAILRTMGNPWVSLLPLDLPGLPYRQFLTRLNQLDDRLRELIAHKQAQADPGYDVLAMLLQARYEESDEGLTEAELMGHANVIFVAGHETSANALTWTLFLLSQHPAIAADLVDELAALNGPPTLAQLAQLPLLDRVVKESLRVLSPVPWNGRITSQPVEMQGHELPAGTEVFVSITQTHQMPDLYPQPRRFDPARWETLSPTPYEYNPFSAGPRLCIGAGFAIMEIKLVLAMLLQRYRLQLVPQSLIDQSGVIVMSPVQGMPMYVHPQDQKFESGGDVRGNIHELVELPVRR
ncbi:MAG: cytochrome P450 [Elainellaceae cyanobacterium]